MKAGTQLNIAVVTVSDTRTEETDTSGNVLVEALKSAGHCLLYTSPSPRDRTRSRMPSSA